MVLEDGSSILKIGTARGIFSFGGQKVLKYHSEAQIHVLRTNNQGRSAPKLERRKEGGKEERKKKKEGRKKKRKKRSNTKYWQRYGATGTLLLCWLECEVA